MLGESDETMSLQDMLTQLEEMYEFAKSEGCETMLIPRFPCPRCDGYGIDVFPRIAPCFSCKGGGWKYHMPNGQVLPTE